jgi:hypothetical protein
MVPRNGQVGRARRKPPQNTRINKDYRRINRLVDIRLRPRTSQTAHTHAQIHGNAIFRWCGAERSSASGSSHTHTHTHTHTYTSNCALKETQTHKDTHTATHARTHTHAHTLHTALVPTSACTPEARIHTPPHTHTCSTYTQCQQCVCGLKLLGVIMRQRPKGKGVCLLRECASSHAISCWGWTGRIRLQGRHQQDRLRHS